MTTMNESLPLAEQLPPEPVVELSPLSSSILATDEVRESPWLRVWHGVVGLVSRLVRGRKRRATATESALVVENALLRDRTNNQARCIASLQHDIRVLQSDNKLRGLEIERLVEIVARDRQRVAAEAAGFASAIAKATAQPPRQPETQYGNQF